MNAPNRNHFKVNERRVSAMHRLIEKKAHLEQGIKADNDLAKGLNGNKKSAEHHKEIEAIQARIKDKEKQLASINKELTVLEKRVMTRADAKARRTKKYRSRAL